MELLAELRLKQGRLNSDENTTRANMLDLASAPLVVELYRQSVGGSTILIPVFFGNSDCDWRANARILKETASCGQLQTEQGL
jgi:hypothetical protein